MAQRPYAVFDIDGTLIRWQLYHALADDLARNGLLDAAAFQKVRAARMNWKTRRNPTSFSDYEHALVQLIDGSIRDITPDELKAACQRVIGEYRDQVYTFTRELLKELKAKNYLLFAISASQMEIIGMVAHYYGFDDYGGTQYEVKDGRFTGDKIVLKKEKKPNLLRLLIAKHDATQAGSIGVGDSESDIPMLEGVAKPIAFNPTANLYAHAKQQGWDVVIERKNVVYQLQAEDHGYRVA